jgi:triphosphoribosyl-dephospho-CoA synthase
MTMSLSIGQTATLACVLEVSAPKPGNVHRGADFEDCTLADFLASAIAIGPAMETASRTSVGQTALASIEATRQVTDANTNLGIVLLLSPLAVAAESSDMRTSIGSVLSTLTPGDSNDVYAAIRLAKPGGIDSPPPTADRMDINGKAPADLLAAMRVAASYDMIARQYANNFTDVFERVVPWLVEKPEMSLTSRVIQTHLRLMHEFPDSLIQRKCGITIAEESSSRAARVLDSGPVDSDAYNAALADFDFWLRSDGNRRNPGTTADLIAAGLFVAIRENRIRPPFN